jgi:hypothetical protein
MANTTTRGTTTSPSKKQHVTITLYRVEYELEVNKDLTANIKSLIREANRGRKGYKSPSVTVIKQRLLKAWSMKGSTVKTEFSSPETKGANVPFALVCFG